MQPPCCLSELPDRRANFRTTTFISSELSYLASSELTYCLYISSIACTRHNRDKSIISRHQNGFRCQDHRCDRRLIRHRKSPPSHASIYLNRHNQSHTSSNHPSQGLEAIKQLLQQSQPYRVILGARNIKATEEAYGGITYDKSAHNVSILPLELSNLRDVKRFASETLEKLGKEKIDYLLLNAAISNGSEQPGPHGSKWSEPVIVNHFCE